MTTINFFLEIIYKSIQFEVTPLYQRDLCKSVGAQHHSQAIIKFIFYSKRMVHASQPLKVVARATRPIPKQKAPMRKLQPLFLQISFRFL
eukprot:c51858_g1_i1 orf=79-348(-)